MDDWSIVDSSSQSLDNGANTFSVVLLTGFFFNMRNNMQCNLEMIRILIQELMGCNIRCTLLQARIRSRYQIEATQFCCLQI